MSLHVAAGTHHTYQASGHDTPLSEICDVHCILMPRALLVAGFSQDGQVIMLRYNSYAAGDPAWDTSFFEHEFMTEKLLGVPQQVKALFIGSRDELLIPKPLYNERAAGDWMKSLHAICPDDVLHTYTARADDAQYMFALPARMDKLLHRYFGNTRILPVGAYQFHKPVANGQHLIRCLITQDTVIATLHDGGRLLWHQQFAYSAVEDIAWQYAYLCRELHIPRIDLRLECTLLCDDCYDLAPGLECFFPKIRWSSATSLADEEQWAPVVYLAQQLYACAL